MSRCGSGFATAPARTIGGAATETIRHTRRPGLHNPIVMSPLAPAKATVSWPVAPWPRHAPIWTSRGGAYRRAAPLAIATAASLKVLGASLLGLLSDADIGLGCLPAPGEQLLRVFVAH